MVVPHLYCMEETMLIALFGFPKPIRNGDLCDVIASDLKKGAWQEFRKKLRVEVKVFDHVQTFQDVPSIHEPVGPERVFVSIQGSELEGRDEWICTTVFDSTYIFADLYGVSITGKYSVERANH